MDRTSTSKLSTLQDLAFLLIGLVLFIISIQTACPPPSLQTREGKTAWTADQVVLRIGELQTAAIDANEAGLLSKETTRRVVQFSVDAIKTLKESPDGWQATVRPAYAGMKNQLSESERAGLRTYLSVLDAILGGTP